MPKKQNVVGYYKDRKGRTRPITVNNPTQDISVKRYKIFKKTRLRSGHIKRTLYLDKRSTDDINELIRSHSGAGVFTRGRYVAFEVHKDGSLSKMGVPFEI
jgi:hypothetical protein